MWSEFIQGYNNLRNTVFPYIQSIVDTFNEKLGDIIDRLGPIVGSAVDLVVPEFMQEMTLLGVMTASFLPAILVVFIVKLFT